MDYADKRGLWMRARRIAANIATKTLVHQLRSPNSPVCRQDGKLLFSLGVQPTADKPPTRKRESVFAVAVDNGEFHIGAEGSGIYWLPVHVDSSRLPN
jgi:hypothetical protein